MPKVSVVMPAFRLASRVNSVGVPYVQEVVGDVLSQTFHDFEWVILDNRSDDETIRLLESLVGNDPRVKIVEDTRRRLPEEGIRKLIDLVDSPFCQIINDDDRLAPNYLSQLVLERERASGANVVYSQANYISPDGALQGSVIRSKSELYGLVADSASDFARYLYFRNPVPLTFGLWERGFLDDTYPREVIDEYHANVDNLFILKCILAGMKAKHIDKSLFSYRQRPRSWKLEDSFPSQAGSADAFAVATRMILHQARFAELLLLEASRPSSTIDQRRAFPLVVASLEYAAFQALKWSLALYPVSSSDFANFRPFAADFLRPRRRHWKSWSRTTYDQSVRDLVSFRCNIATVVSSAEESHPWDQLSSLLGRMLDHAASG